MKKGCLTLLFLWIALGVGYQFVLPFARAGTPWWAALLLGLSVVVAFASAWSLVLSFKKLMASRRPVESWRDGQYVAFSGTLDTLGEPLKSPISGRDLAIAEYEVKRPGNSSKRNERISDYRGFLMAPCGFSGPRGVIRLHGFPLLISFPEESYDEIEHLERFAEFLKHAELREGSKNPMHAINELLAVLGDEDGDVSAHFAEPHALVKITAPDLSEESDADEEAEPSRRAELPVEVSGGGRTAEEDDDEEDEEKEDKKIGATGLVAAFKRAGYVLSERLIAPGTEISAFGTYNLAQPAINVGSGITNISHAISLGPLRSTVGRALRNSTLALLFWTLITLGAHIYLFPPLQGYVQPQIDKIKNTITTDPQ